MFYDPSKLGKWLILISGFVAALALGSGPLHHGGSPSLVGGIVIAALILAAGLHSRRLHLRVPGEEDWLAELETSFLIAVFTWTLFRLGKPFLPHLILLPAMVIAWITARYRRSVWFPTVFSILVIEAELVLTGNQSLGEALVDLTICSIAAVGLHIFPGGRLYKAELVRVRKALAKNKANRERASDMGLADDKISDPDILLDIDRIDSVTVNREQTVENINKSFELQLEMVRAALKLTSVAVLWSDPTSAELRLRYLATTRQDINPGPYPAGTGITGAMTGNRDEIELSGVKPSHPSLPYYHKHDKVGAILALRIPLNLNDHAGPETARTGILCVDRESDSPWSDRERRVLRISAEKLGLEISSSRLLLNMDRERATIHRLCHGLRELNSDPSLDSIFASSIKAAKAQVPTDLLALCLKQGDRYQVVIAEGEGAAELINCDFSIEEGLVGQTIKTGRTLPANGRYRGTVPVFAAGHTFDLQSLLVIPLPDDDNLPIGCLVAAAGSPQIFTKNSKEILEIIAAQIAIKVKLGQAHEQLALLATTDGLTGLANHRAFQHGCTVMFERAKRNNHSLCLMLGDLDYFKNINDRYGHPYGDEVLKIVASVMAESVRTVDLAARYGGEEFALLLENCDAKGGLVMAERIREKIAQLKLFRNGEQVPVTISLGVAIFPGDCSEKDHFIELADQALYRAKKAGRNRTVRWSATNGR